MKEKRILIRATLSVLFSLLIFSQASAKIGKGPYLQNPKQTEMTICWETAAPSTGKIIYSPVSAAQSQSVAKEVAVSEKLSFHEVKITDLSPGTDYYYSVVETSGDKAKGTFRTAPAGTQPFRFAAYGDSRTNYTEHSKIIKLIMKYTPAFVINSGDLVEKGEKQDLWDQFWKIVKPLVRNIPYFPALGNHEDNSSIYYKYFSLPSKNENYYSFAYSNVFFIAIDSAGMSALTMTQKKWVDAQLKGAANYDFKVTYFHHPFYSSSKRAPNDALRNAYQPIFAKYGVQMILNGHDHFYERSRDQYGIWNIVTGGGGAPLYDFVNIKPESIVRKKSYHFMIFDVEGKTMKASVIDDSNKVIDSFVVDAK